MSASKLLFIVTGSIAAYKACEVISHLVQGGTEVRVVATRAALNFVGPATLESLTGAAPLCDTFAPGSALEHIALTRWADAVIVCPATANTLNRLAAGLGDDLCAALFLAHDRSKPWIMFPAMNPRMWTHPATVAAVERLRAWGIRIVDPSSGPTACGESGPGRLPEPSSILSAIGAALVPPGTPRRRVLITAGATSEPIDAVRVISNGSTGATGAALATHFSACGHAVTLLRSRYAARPSCPCAEVEFSTFAELDHALDALLGESSFDAVIHAAAVGDFGVSPRAGKLASDRPLTLRLRPRPKLLPTLQSRSATPLRIVAFKLTAGADSRAVADSVRPLFAAPGVELVVHNDLHERVQDFPATLYVPDGSVHGRCPTRRDLAQALERWLTLQPIHR